MDSQRKQLFDRFISNGFLGARAPHAQRKNVERYAANYRRRLPADKHAPVLEIGFGMGECLRFLRDNGYDNLLGVEVSKEMYNYTREHVTKDVRLIAELIPFLQTHREAYDCVIMNDVIEHLPKNDIIPTLAAIRTTLRPGGTTLIKTGNAASITGCRMRYIDFTHEVGFTESSLTQVLRNVGFENIRIHPFRMPRNSTRRLIRYGLQRAFNAVWRMVYWLQYTTVPRCVDEIIFAVAKK